MNRAQKRIRRLREEIDPYKRSDNDFLYGLRLLLFDKVRELLNLKEDQRVPPEYTNAIIEETQMGE
jgi:hypothetical protein